jgi:hypothetical protein
MWKKIVLSSLLTIGLTPATSAQQVYHRSYSWKAQSPAATQSTKPKSGRFDLGMCRTAVRQKQGTMGSSAAFIAAVDRCKANGPGAI